MGNLLLVASLVVLAGGVRPVDFDTEIIPVLTRGGCNAGACHGAAIGRGGFRLSLLGGDPARDREAEAGRSDEVIVDEFYLRALTRMHTAEESAYWRGSLGRATSRAEREAMPEDFAWSLLNSREFRTNH